MYTNWKARQETQSIHAEICQLSDAIVKLKSWETEFENYLNGIRSQINEYKASNDDLEHETKNINKQICDVQNERKSLYEEKCQDTKVRLMVFRLITLYEMQKIWALLIYILVGTHGHGQNEKRTLRRLETVQTWTRNFEKWKS